MPAKLNFKFPEWGDAAPKEAGHYQFESLNRPEKFLIRLVYWKQWRHLVVGSRLSKNQASYAKRYFYELHTRYYRTVVKGGPYVTVVRLIRNFFLSKAQENLRTVLASVEPYNLTSFVQGLRSQIEINALLHKFLIDPEYHRAHFLLNEDRARVKEVPTTINVNTLIGGLDKSGSPLPYAEIYDALSLLLHPNPSAIKFYAQAERPSSNESGPMQPQVKFYFDETITHTQSTADWFSRYAWIFLTCVEHFLILFDGLRAEFYLNDQEQSEHQATAMAAFVAHNQSAILKAVNDAVRSGGDVEAATREIVARLLDEQVPKASAEDRSD
jgi:hypothetical protein